MSAQHLGGDGMRPVQPDGAGRPSLRRRFRVLLLSAGSGRLLVDRLSAELMGGSGMRPLQQNGSRPDGVRGRFQVPMLQRGHGTGASPGVPGRGLLVVGLPAENMGGPRMPGEHGPDPRRRLSGRRFVPVLQKHVPGPSR